MSKTQLLRVRKSVDFGPALYQRILTYGRKRGCTNFGEIIRDMTRTVLDPGAIQGINDNKKRPGKQR
jgi:hypothetical protein